VFPTAGRADDFHARDDTGVGGRALASDRPVRYRRSTVNVYDLIPPAMLEDALEQGHARPDAIGPAGRVYSEDVA